MESMAGTLLVLTMPVMPALHRGLVTSSRACQSRTHKMPQLMAIATPNFSFFFICKPHISFQGSNARAKSMRAE